MTIEEVIEGLEFVKKIIGEQPYTIFINANNKLAIRYKMVGDEQYSVWTVDISGNDGTKFVR